eukprot:562224-Rhodomonas_salina.2
MSSSLSSPCWLRCMLHSRSMTSFACASDLSWKSSVDVIPNIWSKSGITVSSTGSRFSGSTVDGWSGMLADIPLPISLILRSPSTRDLVPHTAFKSTCAHPTDITGWHLAQHTKRACSEAW